IYRHHPSFADGSFADWSHDLESPPELEGGDVLVIGNGAVMIGMGERTKAAAVEVLARRLFLAGVARRGVAVAMPRKRSTMHVDTVMTMVDRDAFTIYPAVRAELRAFSLFPSS